MPTVITAAPVINNSGQVFTSAGRVAAINNNGTVVYVDDTSLVTRNINGGPVTTVATIDAATPFRSFVSASINDGGVVVFHAGLANGAGIFAWNGVSLATIADTSGPLDGFLNSSNIPIPPTINSDGAVAFTATSDAPSAPALFVGSGGTVTPLYEPNEAFGSFSGAAINNSGYVGFIGLLTDGTRAVFRGDGGPPVSFMPITTPFGGSVSINNHGAVAFMNGSRQTGSLFIADSPLLMQRVIGGGDALFGSTVNSLEFSRPGQLNDRGEVVFRYTLTNGSGGIAVASPVPEPATMVLATLAILGLGSGYWHLRRRRG